MTIEATSTAKFGHHDVSTNRVSTPVMPQSGPGNALGEGARKEQQKGKTDAKSTPRSSGQSQRHYPDTLIKRYRIEIAASSSSVLSTLAAFPLDSVKTRMQTYEYRGFIDCVQRTYKAEKLGGFFRGQLASPRTEHVKSSPRMLTSTYRRNCSHGQHYACADCFLFHISAS